MKKVFAFLTALVLTISVFAQTPQKMSYQAVIRDASNNLVSNQVIGIKVSILEGSASGTVVYTETQTPTSNYNGLVSIEIGGGTGFDAIDWGNGTYFLECETDPTGGSNYTISGVSQLLSVPYAFHCSTAETVLQQPWIIFQDSTHSVIGNNYYPTVNTGMTNVFLGDSAGIYNSIGASNTFLGSSSGLFNTEGSENIALGKNALRNNGKGVGNIAIGLNALASNKDSTAGIGSHNLAIGVDALRNAVSESNVAIGHQAMEFLTCGMQNTGIGEHVMRDINSGYYNTAIGYGSMYNCSGTADGNVSIGVRAGEQVSGQGNVFIGYQSGQTNLGNHNVFLGYYAGNGTNWQNVSNKLVISSDISNIDNPLIYGEFDNKIVKITDVLQLAPRTSAPSNPTEGTLYVNSSSHHIFCYLNGVWKQIDN